MGDYIRVSRLWHVFSTEKNEHVRKQQLIVNDNNKRVVSLTAEKKKNFFHLLLKYISEPVLCYFYLGQEDESALLILV